MLQVPPKAIALTMGALESRAASPWGLPRDSLSLAQLEWGPVHGPVTMASVTYADVPASRIKHEVTLLKGHGWGGGGRVPMGSQGKAQNQP